MERRMIVCSGPDDNLDDYSHHYNSCSEVKENVPLNVTEFRKHERLYKYRITPRLHSIPDPVSDPAARKQQRQWKKFRDERAKESEFVPDLEDLEAAWRQVIDFRNLDWNSQENKDIIEWEETVDGEDDKKYLKIKGLDGFAFFPRALDLSQQKDLVKDCYGSFSDRPNKTSMDLIYEIPEQGLWNSFVQGLECVKRHGHDERAAVPIDEALLRKWRWTNIGKDYNWTSKSYDDDDDDDGGGGEEEKKKEGIPVKLTEICKEIAAKMGFSDYEPDAGIINFYQLRDSLTGHIDRSERNKTAPLVSISLGQSGIFLIGGKSRNATPIRAIIVRSGDIMVMSGACRWYFHGVPRIVENDPCELFKESRVGAGGVECDCDCDRENNGSHARDCWSIVGKIARNSRINVNVRQFK